MQLAFPLVTATLFVPLLGAALLVVLGGLSPRSAHAVGLAASGLALAGSAAMWVRGVAGASGGEFAQVEAVEWIPSIGVAYRVGVDGISLPLVLLTTVLFFLSFVFSSHISDRARSYVALMLLMETACLGVFVALDAILFYVFFEVTLVGMYFIISGWGYEQRGRAALTFFLYTLLGSLPLLLAILGLYLASEPRTFDMRAYIDSPPLAGATAMLALIAMLVTFFVKIPVLPVHTWLPLAHTEAPTAGSVILAGVMLKLGTYGLVRFALQMTPDAFLEAAPYVAALGVLSALYGAFAALAQTDLKRLVAYTSVNHMGYVVLGVAVAAAATGTDTRARALDGAVLQMVSHGLVTGALFFIVGMLQDRAHTREMDKYSGVLRAAPVLGWAFVLAAFASLGLPGLAHFPAEFQVFLATLGVYPVAVVVVLGIAVTAGLYLRALGISFLGEPGDGPASKLPDLGRRELLTLIPLLALIVVVGVVPSLVLDVVHATTARILP